MRGDDARGDIVAALMKMDVADAIRHDAYYYCYCRLRCRRLLIARRRYAAVICWLRCFAADATLLYYYGRVMMLI